MSSNRTVNVLNRTINVVNRTVNIVLRTVNAGNRTVNVINRTVNVVNRTNDASNLNYIYFTCNGICTLLMMIFFIISLSLYTQYQETQFALF